MLVLAIGVAALGLGAPPDDASSSWVSWDAPDACPTVEDFSEATRARLGRAPAVGEVAVAATIEDRNADGLRLRLQIDRGGEEDLRTMTAHDCRALTDAAALIVALSVDPIAVVENTTTPAQGEPAAPSVIAPPPALPPVVEPAQAEPAYVEEVASPVGPEERAPPPPTAARADARPVDVAPTEVMLGGGGGIELGALPGLSGGPTLSFAIGWKRVRVEAGGWWLAPRVARGDTASVRVTAGAASIRACGRLRAERIEVPLCGGFEAGGSRGRGIDAPNARVASGLWLAPTVGAGIVGWVIPRLAVFGRAEVGIPVARTAFDIRDPGEPIELFRPGAASGRLWIGIEGKLWRR